MWEILKNHEESIPSVMSGLGKAKVREREREYSDGWRDVFKCSCLAEREVRSGEPHARVQRRGGERSPSFKAGIGGKAPSISEKNSLILD